MPLISANGHCLYPSTHPPSEKCCFALRPEGMNARPVYEYYDPEVSSVARPVQLEVRQR